MVRQNLWSHNAGRSEKGALKPPEPQRFLRVIKPGKAPTTHTEGKEKTMKNVDMSIKDNILTVKVDLAKEFGHSASGKTIIIASTEGNQRIEGSNAVMGLNVYKKPS
jgi:hypothetical protein